MKTIYSMQEFYDKVFELAKTKNEDYINIEVTIGNKRKAMFTCYVNNYGRHTADTMEESIQKLKDRMSGEEIKNIDVEVEQELITQAII